MPDITCAQCGSAVADLDVDHASALSCPRCGTKVRRAHQGLRAGQRDKKRAPRLGDDERLKANLDDLPRAIVLGCPQCQSHYEWTTALSVSEVNETPACPKCECRYPMECHECGLDLRVGGFEARVLNGSEELPVERRPWSLFCPPCAERYDIFTITPFEMKPCAQCNKMVPAGELRLRMFRENLGASMIEAQQEVFRGLCAECAGAADRGPTRLLGGMIGIVVVVLLFVLVCWVVG